MLRGRAWLLTLFLAIPAFSATISGHLDDPQGKPVRSAAIRLSDGSKSIAETRTGAAGEFSFKAIPPGVYALEARRAGFSDCRQPVTIGSEDLDVDLKFAGIAEREESVTVTAAVDDAGIFAPDPAQRLFVRSKILDANPGRPGAPVSVPGLPIETASSGIKAPQYFAPGVAGDHGEPIALFLKVGGYLVPDNLSANAHGNGYADPNIMVPAVIESVQTDGGAFNVREGNHSVDLAAIYGFHDRLAPFVTLTGDYRDADLTAGWSPATPGARAWIALEAALGNGFLDRLEHRQQYKINGFRIWDIGSHQVTWFGTGYYGQSKIPGLVPVDIPNLHDTIDPRQRDQTHTVEFALNDRWKVATDSELQVSSFFRTYNLSLDSNFGDGLIRQSEFRTGLGGEALYTKRFNDHFTILTGVDYLREAPRRDDLDHYESNNPYVYGPFEKITANNLTIGLITPFVAVDGNLTPWLRYNLGWRRDQVSFDNADLLHPANSFHRWAGVNNPKSTLTFVPRPNQALPMLSFSFGQTFFTNDPRVGTGMSQGSLVSRAHSFQLVASKTILGVDFRATLGRVTQEASLAKIDPDTGLQFDEGPGRNRYITLSARHYFRRGLLQASFSKADARDVSAGTPIPEAPRLIYDILGTWDRLPFGLHARGEFEEVGRKPLGDGFVSVPVKEFRGALVRSFRDGKLEAGVNFLIASGYTGQTTEILALPGEGGPSERVAGVYLPSYATMSFTYHFRPR
jgi:hypothetical protein